MGMLVMYESPTSLLVHGELTGFTDEKERAIHVHESGDLGDQCVGTGAHWNPKNTNHGDIDDPADKRHAGDWANFKSMPDRTVVHLIDKVARLSGEYNVSIVGDEVQALSMAGTKCRNQCFIKHDFKWINRLTNS